MADIAGRVWFVDNIYKFQYFFNKVKQQTSIKPMNHEIYKNNEINKFNVCRFVSLNCILLFKYFTKTIMLWWIGAYIVRFVHDKNCKRI